MKRFLVYPLLLASAAFFSSCGQQQSEADRNAEVERQVQQRLAAEKQTADEARLAQTQADLDARERALADREAAATAGSATPARDVSIAQTTREREANSTSSRSNREAGTSASQHRTSASFGTFYQKLEPYGAWLETNDYGYVWQPNAAEQSRTWRPYTEGHWVYTDAGWTWISEEPFGWATYHYGRWVRLKRVGWCWVPGDEWAPAWVSWRSSNEYVGWAPLPPEARFERRSGIHDWADSYYDIGPEQYAFVSVNQLGDERLSRAVVPAERNVTIVNETRNVTNITYNNTTIVNEGPNYDQYRTRSTRPIKRYQLETRTDINDQAPQPIVRGERISIATPVISAARGYERPPTVRERITDAVVENGWALIADRSAAERARAKVRSEATPPPNAPPKTFVKPVEAAGASPAPAANASATAPAIATTPSSTAIATTTATPSATPRPTQRPHGTPTPTPEATAIATPTATPLPESTANPTATPRASHPPRAETVSTPAATPLNVPTATPNVSAGSARDERHREEAAAKAAAQQQKQAAEATRQAQKQQEQQIKRAAQEQLRNDIRNAGRPLPASTATPAADSAAQSPSATEAIVPPRHDHPRATPRTAPEATAQPTAATTPTSAVATPLPSAASADVRRHERGPKGDPRRGLPVPAAAQQAEPNAAADAVATPAAASAAGSANGVSPNDNAQKNKHRHANDPRAASDAANPNPATPTATATPQQ